MLELFVWFFIGICKGNGGGLHAEEHTLALGASALCFLRMTISKQ